ncbi:hypothetical protein Hanom_Chr13g01243871 [Helianthus anomalus]
MVQLKFFQGYHSCTFRKSWGLSALRSANYRDHLCTFGKLVTKSKILVNQRDHPCTLLLKVNVIIDNAIQENLDFCQIDDDTITVQEILDVNQTEDKTAICDWPSLRTIMEMEPRARVAMLRKRIISAEQMSHLGRPNCAWLFALCAAIDTPLDADTSASLRCLLRKCATLRTKKMSLDNEVLMLNILATVSGKYFGQLEKN